MSAYIEWTREDENGVETVEKIPARWAICDTCNGEGQHSLAIGAITQEDRERDWSDDEFEDYLNGAYDQPCESCAGSGKVRVPDFERMPKALREAYETHLNDEAEYAALVAAERRMGA